MSTSESVVQIVMALPEHPTSGELLRAFVSAEDAGYQRAQRELAEQFGQVRSLVHSIKRGARA